MKTRYRSVQKIISIAILILLIGSIVQTDSDLYAAVATECNTNPVEDQGSDAAGHRLEVTIEDDFSYPQRSDYDYGLNPADIRFSVPAPGVGEPVTITAEVRNNGICKARGAWGWHSSTGRSCWAEWIIDYPETDTTDVQFRCRDDVAVDWRLELDGVHLASPTVPGVGDGMHWKIVTVHDVPITAGPHTLFLGTYQMDFSPDYEVDWVALGNLRREAETYDLMGGNDPNPDYKGVYIYPQGANPPSIYDLRVQIWDGQPGSGGLLLAEDHVGRTNTVIDNGHVYSGGTYTSHYIENGGSGVLEYEWTPTEAGLHEIHVVIDPLEVLTELDEENNVAFMPIHVGTSEVAIVTGPGHGPANPPLVRVFDSSPVEWPAYGVSRFGVNVACGDLDRTGLDAVITGPGPGASYGPHVRAFDHEGNAIAAVNFLAYAGYHHGVVVASGDIDGDGYDEIITGAGAGRRCAPHVRGWNVDGQSGVEALEGVGFQAYGAGKWGVAVACGDIDGDGYEEILTGPGPGPAYGPHVRAWDYDNQGAVQVIGGVNFLAYGDLSHGVKIACGDLNGDGTDEIITGPGPGSTLQANVRSWSYDSESLSSVLGVNFLAYPAECRFGVNLAAADVDGDGLDEILTMPGPDPAQPAHVRAWNVDGEAVTPVDGIDFNAYGDLELTRGGQISCGRF